MKQMVKDLSFLTDKQRGHIERIKEKFSTDMEMKYAIGALEHGGDLQDLPLETLVDFLEEEVIDLYVYLHTIKENLNRCRKESTQQR